MQFGLEGTVADLTLLNDTSIWISFVFSLLIGSLLLGDNFLSRLAQYTLVGIAIGYLGALAIQHVLRPRLIEPLVYSPIATMIAAPQLWLALGLGLLLLLAGIERILAQGAQATESAKSPSLGRQWLRRAGVVPAALLLGVGLSTLFIGILQGTFWPLFWQTAQSGLNWENDLALALTSILILLLTTATLLVWTVPVAQLTSNQPGWVRHLIRWWAAIGKRALWFAAGILFARILASQLSLVIARLTFFVEWFR